MLRVVLVIVAIVGVLATAVGGAVDDPGSCACPSQGVGQPSNCNCPRLDLENPIAYGGTIFALGAVIGLLFTYLEPRDPN